MTGERDRKQTSAQKIVIVSVVGILYIPMENDKRLTYFRNTYKRVLTFFSKICLRTWEILFHLICTFFDAKSTIHRLRLTGPIITRYQ